MKKRIKTRGLTNIYHSDDDDVGDCSNLLSPLSLSLSLSLSLTLSLSLSLSLFPIYLSTVTRAKIFEHRVRVALAIGYSQKRISLTLLLYWHGSGVQLYGRFYGMFNESDGGRTKTIRSKQHRCINPRYIYELLAN